LPSNGFHISLRGRAPLLMITTILVAAIAGLVAYSSPPRYVSSTSILVGPVSADVDTLRASQSLTATYSQLLLRPEAVQQVAAQVRLAPSQVFADADVNFNTDTRIVTLSVSADRQIAAQQIAESLTAALTSLIGTIDPTAPGAASILSAQPQTAVAVSRSPARYALLAGAGWVLLGLAVFAAFAATRESSSVSAGQRAGAVPPGEGLPKRPQLSSEDIELIAVRVREKLLDVPVDDLDDIDGVVLVDDIELIAQRVRQALVGNLVDDDGPSIAQR
jgi:capsular polysaccharide biosynthesis protein